MAIRGHVRMLEYYVTCVVGSELHESQVRLRHQRLLNSAVPEGMEGVEGTVQLHLVQSVLEPFRKLMVEHMSEDTLKVASLDERDVRTDILLADKNYSYVMWSGQWPVQVSKTSFNTVYFILILVTEAYTQF